MTTDDVVYSTSDDDNEITDHQQQYDNAFVNCPWKKNLCGSNTYDIRVEYGQQQHIPVELERPIAMAVDLWSRAIESRPSHHSQVLQPTNELIRQCGNMFSNNNQTVVGGKRRRRLLHFDLLLCFNVEKLDGDPLAAASILLDDPDDGLPRIASVKLNSNRMELIRSKKHLSNSLNQCDWANIIAHEIGHALGFGTLAFRRKCDKERVSTTTPTTATTNSLHYHHHYYYCGGNATREWRGLSRCHKSFPPLNAGNNHWPDDDCLSVELMTPFLSFISYTHNNGKRKRKSNGRLPLSRLTLAALQDLGYQVNYDCADDDESLILRGECKCTQGEREQRKRRPLLCNPNRNSIIKRQRRIQKFKHRILAWSQKCRRKLNKALTRLGKVAERWRKILTKGYLLKPWWWRRKCRSLKKWVRDIASKLPQIIGVRIEFAPAHSNK